eukprot:12908935-Prorocentrum_lima.AAC.1
MLHPNIASQAAAFSSVIVRIDMLASARLVARFTCDAAMAGSLLPLHAAARNRTRDTPAARHWLQRSYREMIIPPLA